MMDPAQIIDRSKAAAKHTLVFKTISQIFGGIAAVLIVRALSEAEYGVYNLLYSVIALLGMVASLGISNTLQRYLPEYYQKGEFRLARNLYRTASLLRLFSNTLILGLVLVFWEMVSPLLNLTAYKPLFMLFSLVIFLDMQRSMLDICLSSFFLQKYSKLIGCIFPLTKLIGYGLIIVYDKAILYAILADLLAYVLVFTGLQILYQKKIPSSGGKHETFPAPEKKRVIRYAMFYNLSDAGDGIFNSYFDNFIIMMFMTPTAVGAYSFCITLTTLIGSVLPIHYFKEIIRTAFFSAGSSNRENNATLFFQHTYKIHSIFTIPCLGFLMVFGHDLIQVCFEGKFIEYLPILCTIFFFFEVLAFPAGMVAQLREKADIVLYSKMFAVYNLLADFILIKHFGLWGAVFATGTAILGKKCFIWYFIRKDACFKGMGGFFLKAVSFWVVTSVLLYAATAGITYPWLRLALGGIGFAAAFILQFQCRYFNDGEKKVWGLYSGQNPRLIYILQKFHMLS